MDAVNENYESELREHNWKLYEASRRLWNTYNERQLDQNRQFDKWAMTVAAGSFGVSFAFIDRLVDMAAASHVGILIAGWTCFLSILLAGFVGFTASALGHTRLAKEEAEALTLRQEGKQPEYKNRGILWDANAVLTYAQILLFVGGAACLLMFLAKNL